jgi:hypothetical protein
MDGTTIRPLYNAFWSIDSFCIYQQGVTDIMHTWSLGILDYVIFSSVNEIISYLRSFKLRGTARRQGEEINTPLFADAFIRRLFTDEVPKLVKNIDQNTAFNDVIERNRANLLAQREDPSPRIIASMCSLLKVKHSIVSEA